MIKLNYNKKKNYNISKSNKNLQGQMQNLILKCMKSNKN